MQQQYNKYYLKLDAHVAKYKTSIKVNYSNIDGISVAGQESLTPFVIAAAGNNYQKPLSSNELNNTARPQPTTPIQSFNKAVFYNYCHLEAPQSKQPTSTELKDFEVKIDALKHKHQKLMTMSLAMNADSDKARSRSHQRFLANKHISDMESNEGLQTLTPYQGDDSVSSQTLLSEDPTDFANLSPPQPLQSIEVENIIQKNQWNEENCTSSEGDVAHGATSSTELPESSSEDVKNALPDQSVMAVKRPKPPVPPKPNFLLKNSASVPHGLSTNSPSSIAKRRQRIVPTDKIERPNDDKKI